jgi:hypothetical protein
MAGYKPKYENICMTDGSGPGGKGEDLPFMHVNPIYETELGTGKEPHLVPSAHDAVYQGLEPGEGVYALPQ